MKHFRVQSGFTLIEVLLVIAIIAILAAIVIVAVNPAKQLGDAQNTQRISDVRAILDAVIQYSLDNEGSHPATLTETTNCLTGGDDICLVDTICSGVSLDTLISQRTYLNDIPADPTNTSTSITGYKISVSSYDRVTVCAPNAYGGGTISVTK